MSFSRMGYPNDIISADVLDRTAMLPLGYALVVFLKDVFVVCIEPGRIFFSSRLFVFLPANVHGLSCSLVSFTSLPAEMM